MTNVFLSYAMEDQEVAQSLVGWLTEKCVVVSWYQDPARRGKRIVRAIEEGIENADLFLLLLSSHYLKSTWCQREYELALQREVDSRADFIKVLDVGSVDSRLAVTAVTGFLRTYDRLDARPPLNPEKLMKLDAALLAKVMLDRSSNESEL